MSLSNLLRKVARVENLETYFLFAIGAVLLVLDVLPDSVLNGFHLETEDYLKIIIFALIVVTFSLSKANTKALHDKTEKVQQRVNDLFLLSRGKVSAIRPELHPTIWEGFVGNYYAINAPWAIENRSKIGYEEMVKKHAARYKDSELTRAIYVFYSHGEEGRYFPRAVDRFCTFAEKLLKICPESASKVFAVVIDEPAPGFTAFIGNKKIEFSAISEDKEFSYGILYINDYPFTSLEGIPKWALISLDHELNGSLLDYAKSIIDDYEPMQLEQFLENYRRTKFSDGEKEQGIATI